MKGILMTSSNKRRAAFAAEMRHLVIPGHIVASSNDFSGGEGSAAFLRGHGTYAEGQSASLAVTAGNPLATMRKRDCRSISQQEVTRNDTMEDVFDDEDSEDAGQRGRKDSFDDKDDYKYTNTAVTPTDQQLVASVVGVVERVNKLISVSPTSTMQYAGQVGDLVVGRIESVAATQWRVDLGVGCKLANLPLASVNLPGGVQRIRTSQDALSMRSMFASEGDLVSAEVQSIQNSEGVGGTVMLHTRSLRYGKLENGCVIHVPPALIVRMKQHFATLPGELGLDVLLGKNGSIWIQRTIPQSWHDEIANSTEEMEAPLAETLQKLRRRHALTPVSREIRETVCRVRNAIEALVMVHCSITPDSIMAVYDSSLRKKIALNDMLLPQSVVAMTENTRV
jgi:exosome complex component RRP4